jgi:hypothetical protein
MLKLTLLAASLLLASAAEKLGPGETKCTCKPGPTNNCDKGTAAAGYHQVCTWQQECHNAANISFSMCVTKGEIVCYRYRYLGSSGGVVSAKPHHPSMTCCDDLACNSRQYCVPHLNGSGTFEYEYDTSNGGTTIMKSWSLNKIARNGWKTAKGEVIKNKPMVCIDKKFDTTHWAKQVVTPFFSMVIIIATAVLACRKRKVGRCDMVFPFIVIIMSFFLTLSEGWVFALFTMLVAAATITTPPEHKGKLVIFQIAFAWLFFGGTNFFFQIGAIRNFGSIAATPGKDALPAIETFCENYFGDWVKIIDKASDWNRDEKVTKEGICMRQLVMSLVIVAYVQGFALFMMMVLTLLAYLSSTKASVSALTTVTTTKEAYVGKTSSSTSASSS